MNLPFLSGKYWWLGISAIVLFTLLLFHALVSTKQPTKPQPAIQPHIITHTVKPQTPKVPAHPILDLFKPNAEKLSKDQAISRTRSELEQLIVISILLKHCALITTEQFQSIHQAGQTYAQSTNLFGDSDTLMHDIQASAQKTYELVYSTTRCDEPSLQQLTSQTLEWQSQFQHIK